MAAKNPHRLQHEFLSHLIKEQTPVTVFLLNSGRLHGQISAFDDFCISLLSDGQLQAVYKQEISIISSPFPVTLWEDPDAPPAPKPVRKPVSAPISKPAPKKLIVERVRRISPLRRTRV